MQDIKHRYYGEQGVDRDKGERGRDTQPLENGSRNGRGMGGARHADPGGSPNFSFY